MWEEFQTDIVRLTGGRSPYQLVKIKGEQKGSALTTDSLGRAIAAVPIYRGMPLGKYAGMILPAKEYKLRRKNGDEEPGIHWVSGEKFVVVRADGEGELTLNYILLILREVRCV